MIQNHTLYRSAMEHFKIMKIKTHFEGSKLLNKDVNKFLVHELGLKLVSKYLIVHVP